MAPPGFKSVFNTAIVPEYQVRDGAVHIVGVGPDNPIIGNTVATATPGSDLIIAEARLASPEKPLVIVSGGPLTTVASALLLAPEIADRIVVFNILVSHFGYNGMDVEFSPVSPDETGDVLVIPPETANLKLCHDEFFRVLRDPALFGNP